VVGLWCPPTPLGTPDILPPLCPCPATPPMQERAAGPRWRSGGSGALTYWLWNTQPAANWVTGWAAGQMLKQACQPSYLPGAQPSACPHALMHTQPASLSNRVRLLSWPRCMHQRSPFLTLPPTFRFVGREFNELPHFIKHRCRGAGEMGGWAGREAQLVQGRLAVEATILGCICAEVLVHMPITGKLCPQFAFLAVLPILPHSRPQLWPCPHPAG